MTTTFTLTETFRNYNNFGQHAEQLLAYTLTGEIRKHDRVRFDMGSDIPEYHMSVKSGGFSLMNGNCCESQDFEGIVEEFFNRVVSTKFAYITKDLTVYVMDMAQFREFVQMFCYLGRESSRNGGRRKVQMRAESKKTLAWLVENIK